MNVNNLSESLDLRTFGLISDNSRAIWRELSRNRYLYGSRMGADCIESDLSRIELLNALCEIERAGLITITGTEIQIVY